MKKTLLSIGSLLVLSMGAFAQSTPRTVLFEHFTQASCGPCASANPSINNYLTGTSLNIVQINYQVAWPGYDPMNEHNTTEPAARVTMYDVTGVPNSVIDGNVFNGAPIGFSGGWTNTTFVNRAADSTEFIVNVNGYLNDALDSVFVTMKVKASDAVSGTFKAYLSVIEKEINFVTAPGSNGEKDFHNVMKKMLPNQNGTALASTSWAVNDSVVITQSWKLANVYNKGRLSVVGWVQKSDKEVMQAGEAEIALPAGLIAADLGVTKNHTDPLNYCGTAFVPKLRVKNNSSIAVDTFQISYTLNNGTPVVENRYAVISAGGTYNHTFPTITLSQGINTISYSVNTDEDNTSDLAVSNNSTETSTFFIAKSIASSPSFTESFETPIIPNMFHDNPNNIEALIASDASGFGQSGRSFVWLNFSNANGTKSSLIWDKMDFSIGYKHIIFSRAYAQYQSENDKLEVFASANCGESWVSVYSKAGSNLKTANATTSFFVPTSTQWQKDTVDLGIFNGESELMIKFTGTSNFGNNLWIDDINLEENLAYGVKESIISSLELYPNPTQGDVNLSFNLEKSENVTVQLFDALGKAVLNTNLGTKIGNVKHQLDLSNYNSGIYFVNIVAGGNTISKKVTLK